MSTISVEMILSKTYHNLWTQVLVNEMFAKDTVDGYINWAFRRDYKFGMWS